MYGACMARCALCAAQATDPAKGPSAWARAVVEGEQVLVCPRCQRERPGWTERAEACPSCASKRLYKSMGDRVCRACGHQWSGSEEDFRLD